MQGAKQAVSNIAASAKAGMDKTKATAQEKVEKMTTRDPIKKQMAEEKAAARIHEAEYEKKSTQHHNAAGTHGLETNAAGTHGLGTHGHTHGTAAAGTHGLGTNAAGTHGLGTNAAGTHGLGAHGHTHGTGVTGSDVPHTGVTGTGRTSGGTGYSTGGTY